MKLRAAAALVAATLTACGQHHHGDTIPAPTSPSAAPVSSAPAFPAAPVEVVCVPRRPLGGRPMVFHPSRAVVGEITGARCDLWDLDEARYRGAVNAAECARWPPSAPWIRGGGGPVRARAPPHRLHVRRSRGALWIAEFAAQRNPAREGTAHQALAEILAAGGDLDEALVEMHAALDLVGEVRALRVEALGAHADLLLRAGRVTEALAVAREGVAQVEGEGGGMAEGESRLRLTLVLALDAGGEPEAAREALRSAREALLARAARIHDPALRRSFLERVQENARTFALARERLGAAPLL